MGGGESSFIIKIGGVLVFVSVFVILVFTSGCIFLPNGNNTIKYEDYGGPAPFTNPCGLDRLKSDRKNHSYFYIPGYADISCIERGCYIHWEEDNRTYLFTGPIYDCYYGYKNVLKMSSFHKRSLSVDEFKAELKKFVRDARIRDFIDEYEIQGVMPTCERSDYFFSYKLIGGKNVSLKMCLACARFGSAEEYPRIRPCLEIGGPVDAWIAIKNETKGT
jgi:hypothetical protein